MKRAKDIIKGYEHSQNAFKRFIYQFLFGLLLVPRFIRNAQYRSEIYYSLLQAKNYHQKSSFTFENRYPDLFTICRDFFSQTEPHRILSFGCSTGEEVKALSGYFPQAIIVGSDINKRSIKLAKSKYRNDRLFFMHSLSGTFKEVNGLDILLCCAVFQNSSNRSSVNNSLSSYSFSKFESTLEILDKKLSKGGLLVIDHCDFRFTDTKLSPKYKALSVPNNQRKRLRPCYNERNEKISDFTENDRVFLKTSI